MYGQNRTMKALLERLDARRGVAYATTLQALRRHLADINDQQFRAELALITDPHHLGHLMSAGLSLDRQSFLRTHKFRGD